MADSAHEWTDEEIKKIERRIREEYKQAQEEITEKWNAYMKKGEERLQNLYNAYVNAPAGEKRAAKKEYQDAVKNYTIMNDRFRAMERQTAIRLADVNKTALDIVNKNLPLVYTKNYNYLQEDFLSMGISFDLVDESTVARLIRDGDIQLPTRKLNKPRDISWNTQQMSSAVLQGILQGESMNKIALRLLPIVDNNENSAIRNARTLVTGAENRGRQDRYDDLEEQGVVMTKIWIATPDPRTRDWHLDMDGQEVGIDEKFSTVLPDGTIDELDYPGDPNGDPANVYNCRCTMRAVTKGVVGSDGKIHYFNRHDHNGLHQDQIEDERERR